MHKITISGKDNRILFAEDGAVLSDVLNENGEGVEHPCSGKGICKKCTLLVDGETVLSCQYKIKSDILVQIPRKGNIATAAAGKETGVTTENMCLCLDLGTTTLALALISDKGDIVKSVTRNNPQRSFGADVMSRIDYAAKNGVERLQKVLIDELNLMIDYLDGGKVGTLFVAGNTTMLHTFFGVDPSGIGQAPYTPEFLEQKKMPAEEVGIKNVEEIISIPNISAFVGADIVSGLGFIQMPCEDKYNFLIDLGTNAEVVLYSKDKLYCTAAAAGPCFEGVNISNGMSAVEGAVYSYVGNRALTIGGGEPKGICATGLIDVIATLLQWEIVDETGFMEEDFEIAKGVSLNQKDIRQFQLAKSAICATILTLLKKAEIGFDDVEKVYVAGGFSAKMNVGNAIKTGLLPKEVRGKICAVDNSCLQGLIKYACEKNDFEVFLKNAEYVDLAKDEYFQDLFIEKMGF